MLTEDEDCEDDVVALMRQMMPTACHHLATQETPCGLALSRPYEDRGANNGNINQYRLHRGLSQTQVDQ